jgi:hypothetical protein
LAFIDSSLLAGVIFQEGGNTVFASCTQPDNSIQNAINLTVALRLYQLELEPPPLSENNPTTRPAASLTAWPLRLK